MRKAAAAVFLLILPALVPFWAVEGTQPAGSIVLWILYGGLVTSGMIFAFTYWRQMTRTWQRIRPHRTTATARRPDALSAGDTHVNPEPFDSDLHALLSHGRGIKDDYLLGGGLPSINKAQRDESHRWTRDTASVLKARDPALAKHFLAAQSHRARLSVLADILGVDEPSAAEVMVAPETSRPPQRRRGPFGEDSYFPQVLVTNDGTEPAEGVRVEIVSWKHRTPDGLFKDSPHFDHPRPLRWEGTTDVVPRRLGLGETARLDLAFTQQQEKKPTHELVLFSYAREGKAGLVDALLGEGHWQAFPRGTYRATVRTTAENAEPHEVALEVQFDAWDRVAVYEADHHVG